MLQLVYVRDFGRNDMRIANVLVLRVKSDIQNLIEPKSGDAPRQLIDR